jgi:hypothetical protein
MKLRHRRPLSARARVDADLTACGQFTSASRGAYGAAWIRVALARWRESVVRRQRVVRLMRAQA